MGVTLYKFHFFFRTIVNKFLFDSYYRIFYHDMMKYRGVFKNQSYSGTGVRFLKRELSDYILSSSPIINKDSVVMDVGGDIGIWTMQVYSKYKPKMIIFEPNQESIKELKKNTEGTNALIIPYGLSNRNETVQLSINGMGSSVFSASPNYDQSEKMEIVLRDVKEAFEELNIGSVAMIKINIEGGEYALLEGMIENGLISKCKIIRVQFHDWIPGAFKMRREIVKKLKRTHDVEWSYPMIWESWIRKKDISTAHTEKEQKPIFAMDYMVNNAPSIQNSIDIFKNEWWSKFPEELNINSASFFNCSRASCIFQF